MVFPRGALLLRSPAQMGTALRVPKLQVAKRWNFLASGQDLCRTVLPCCPSRGEHTKRVVAGPMRAPRRWSRALITEGRKEPCSARTCSGQGLWLEGKRERRSNFPAFLPLAPDETNFIGFVGLDSLV